MNYQETLHYLYTRLPMFSRVGAAAYRKDLHNIRLLCSRLGDPQNSFRSIHVAGTNGKGSVSHMLAAIYQTAGYRVGLYTSPHLYDFRERIRVDGQPIPEEAVVSFTENVRPLIEELEPSFFEITVAMAFEHFARETVDIAIVEVGLGGRLDSTNIIQPQLSIITNIGWDHMNLLGDTLPQIAAEKGGIIKPGVTVVIGEHGTETDPVFLQIAAEKGAPIHFAEDDFEAILVEVGSRQSTIEVRSKPPAYNGRYVLDLPGAYQAKNIKTVLEAIFRYQDPLVVPAVIRKALSEARKLTGLGGRWEVLSEKPLLVLEVAHNREGVVQMLEHLERLSFERLHLVLGMVKDKDITPVLRLLPRDAAYYFTEAAIPRALPAPDLQLKAKGEGLSGAVYPEVNGAVEAALRSAGPQDCIIVCGSIFLVAEVDRARFSKE